MNAPLVINAINVNQAWETAKKVMREPEPFVTHRPSRVGDVIEYAMPVITTYQRPWERILFDPVRDCNPYFHFMEGLWMLAGSNDVAWLCQFNSQMAKYSDDGLVFAGAYGHRWRQWFDMPGGGPEDDCDQLPKIIRMLKKNPDERRAVLCMWDPVSDLEAPNCLDIPCNTNIYFKIRNGQLLMTVCNRSNDICFGLYGANAVHMSMLMEYMASKIGVGTGPMTTISDSYHAYVNVWEKQLPPAELNAYDFYEAGITSRPLMSHPEVWDEELWEWISTCWLSEPMPEGVSYKNKFFQDTAWPLMNSWRAWKNNDIPLAKELLEYCHAADWKLACSQWLQRRSERRAAKGVVNP